MSVCECLFHVKIVFSACLNKLLGTPIAEEWNNDARGKPKAPKLVHYDNDDEARLAPLGNVACVEPAAAHRADAVEENVEVPQAVALIWVARLNHVNYD